MNIVIYARYSSNKQTEQSIEGQLRVCKEYAERNNLTIMHEYIDRAKSGTKDNRPDFLQMIDDAKKKEFEAILVYKLDRFSRNKYDSVVYKHKLEKFGVKVISATESISDGPEGKLVEGLLEMIAEMYSMDLSQKTKRGMKESLIKGNFIGGHILYGYKVIDKKIYIDEDKAAAVRYLFEEYANGKPKKQIIKELNDKGFRTRNNRLLTTNNFQNNLSNKKYIGVYDNGTVQNLDYYPAIISKELFDKVQKRLAINKHNAGKQKSPIEYLLTGKLFCGYCGNSMVGVSGTSQKGTKHCYYACSVKYKLHKCNKKYENKESMEQLVIDETIKNVLIEENIKTIARSVVEETNKNASLLKIKEYENRINQIEKNLDKCFDDIFFNDNDDLKIRLKNKADSLSLQKKDLQEELKKLKLASKLNHSEQDIVNIISFYVSQNKEDIEFKRKIINSFINRIYVFDNRLVIYYNLFGEDARTFDQMQEDLKNNDKTSSNTKCIGEPKFRL